MPQVGVNYRPAAAIVNIFAQMDLSNAVLYALARHFAAINYKGAETPLFDLTKYCIGWIYLVDMDWVAAFSRAPLDRERSTGDANLKRARNLMDRQI